MRTSVISTRLIVLVFLMFAPVQGQVYTPQAQTLMVEREVCSTIEMEFPEERVNIPFCIILSIYFIPGDAESSVYIDIPFRITFSENKTIERTIRIPVSVRGEIKQIYIKQHDTRNVILITVAPAQTPTQTPVQETPPAYTPPFMQTPVYQPPVTTVTVPQFITVVQERTVTQTPAVINEQLTILVMIMFAVVAVAVILATRRTRKREEKPEKPEKKPVETEKIDLDIRLDTGDVIQEETQQEQAPQAENQAEKPQEGEGNAR